MILKDKVALVTGSSRGMGKAIAVSLANQGTKVVVNYRSNEDQARRVVEEIKKQGAQSICVAADLTNPKEVKSMFSEATSVFGGIDFLVNNAGIEKPQPFLNIKPADIEAVFKTNIISLFYTSQEAVKIMRKKGKGKIINIASVRGFVHMGRVNNMDYSASKAAVINFTKTLAKAVAPDITVNAVAPGPTNTDMAKTWTAEERAKKERSSRIGRLMEPTEIASAVVYLASDQADGITGEVLVVDGGYSLGSD